MRTRDSGFHSILDMDLVGIQAFWDSFSFMVDYSGPRGHSVDFVSSCATSDLSFPAAFDFW